MVDDLQRGAFFLTINNPIEHGFSHDEIKRILVENFKTLVYFCMSDEIGGDRGTILRLMRKAVKLAYAMRFLPHGILLTL